MALRKRLIQRSIMRGFTLVELLVTLAVAAILLGVGLPAFDSTMVRSRIAAQTNDFLSALAFARSEAIKRSRSIRLVAKGGDWASGYTVELQADGTVLRDYSALSGNSTFTATGSETAYTFDARGMITTPTSSLELCHGAAHDGRSISITAAGIANVAKKSDCL